ncbi:hypothetical protein LTR53_005778 [Teratosphaeriaceae sp. CCFEE 6253]|nr:hypothetical protein LTR53_005778 [Teratosphaeriaceae sp. CCFEE 6253]
MSVNFRIVWLHFLCLAVNKSNAAAYPRYAHYSTSLSISQSTTIIIPSAFLPQQPVSPSVLTRTIPTLSLSTNITTASSTLATAEHTTILAPSGSSRTREGLRSASSHHSASRSAAHETAPAPALAPPHLSIATGVRRSIPSVCSHHATGCTTARSADRVNSTRIPLLVTSAGPSTAVSQTTDLTVAWNLTGTKSSSTTPTNTDTFGLFIAAVEQVASLSGSDPASVTGLVAPAARMAAPEEDPSTTNALSILLSAAPSELAASVESVFQSLTSELLASATQRRTETPTPEHPSTSRETPRPTSDRFTRGSRPTPSATQSIAITTSSASSSTFLTIANAPTSLTSTTATPSTTAAAASQGLAHPLKNASVAGIATGLAAGAVLFALAALFLYRRRQQGKPLPFFGAGGRGARTGSQRSSKRGSRRIFPEVAWLYDPSRTPREGSPPPPRTEADREGQRERGQEMEMAHSRHESAASLIPEPRAGAIELSPAPHSPQLRASDPLLSPPMVGSGRDESPGRGSSDSASRSGGRRSGSGSPVGRKSRASFSRPDPTRPMSLIWEEPPRPSMDARTGLLAPGTRSVQRHST